MSASREHIIRLPAWFRAVRVLQGLSALVLVGFAAFSIHLISFNAYYLTMSTALFTLAILTYDFVAHHKYPAAYLWPVSLGLESVVTLLWLCCWAMLAAVQRDGIGFVIHYNPPYRRSLEHRSLFNTYRSVLVAAIVFTVASFLLHSVSLLTIVRGVFIHRRYGRPVRSAPAVPRTWQAWPSFNEMKNVEKAYLPLREPADPEEANLIR